MYEIPASTELTDVSQFQMYWFVRVMSIINYIIKYMGCSLTQYKQTIGVYSGG